MSSQSQHEIEYDARVAKLPKWAQDRILSLERTLEQKMRTLAQIADGSGDNPFSYENGLDRGPGPIPKKFHLPQYANLSVFAADDYRGARPGTLDLSVGRGRGTDGHENILQVSTPRGKLVIMPSCTNVIYIKGEDF